MNKLFVGAARRGERVSPFARSSDAGTPTNAALRERLSGALTELERAKRTGADEAMVEFHDFRVEKALNDARAARTGEPEQGTEQPRPSFDGGVQKRPRPMPGGGQETASSLFVRAMMTSRQERAERDADPGHTTIANDF
ncbi:MAG TPA: hypothetical protein VK538_08200 [Solirubrobacteraceae bacterium]|nr:hypothetical protein [Solirubrobacteraceae bacterium]